MYYGAKVYYHFLTGQVLQVVPPQAGELVKPTTKDQDMQIYATLKGRIPATVGVLNLDYPYGKYASEFAAMTPVQVNVYTGGILFTAHPDVPLPEIFMPLTDRMDQAEFALAGTFMDTVMLGQEQAVSSDHARSVENALADLTLQHCMLQTAFHELQEGIALYKNVTAALLTEVTLLKGGGKDV